MIKKYKFVVLEWLDAESDQTWANEDEVSEWSKEDCIIHEKGWLVTKNKKYLVITNQITYDGMIGNRTKIPVKWIRKIKEVVPDEEGRAASQTKKHKAKTTVSRGSRTKASQRNR